MSTKPVTDVTDAPGGEIPEKVVERVQNYLSTQAVFANSDEIRAALSAAGVGKLVEALKKYGKHKSWCGYVISGLDCGCGWDETRSALSSFTGTRT